VVILGNPFNFSFYHGFSKVLADSVASAMAHSTDMPARVTGPKPRCQPSFDIEHSRRNGAGTTTSNLTKLIYGLIAQ